MALLAYPRSLITSNRGFIKPSPSWVLNLNHPLSKGLLAYWPLGDSQGTGIPADIGPRGRNGSFVSSPVVAFGHHGGVSQSLVPTGSYVKGGRVTIPNRWSVSFWVYLVSYLQGNNEAEFFSGMGDKDSRNVGLLLSSHVLFGYSGSSPYAQGVTTLTLSTWYNVTHTVGAGGVQQLYLNGKPDGAAVTNASLAATSEANPEIGGNSFYGRLIGGYIDNVRLYERGLTPSEAALLYAEPYAGLSSVLDYRVGTIVTRPVKMAGRWGGFAGSSGGVAA